jgi:ATP adenylyltransferase
MKQLWAPWRLAFIENADHGSGCIFCEKPALKQDAKTFILWRGRHAFVLMNIYPYNNGHLLIAPYRHIAGIEDLPKPVVLDMMLLVQRAVRAVRRAYAPEGFNIGINQGRVAGAGIEHHLHLHLVPRWGADTNFMPLLAETRVLPQHLKASYRRLRAAFAGGAGRQIRTPSNHAAGGAPEVNRNTRRGRPARRAR